MDICRKEIFVSESSAGLECDLERAFVYGIRKINNGIASFFVTLL
jgi:hypothetical protein